MIIGYLLTQTVYKSLSKHIKAKLKMAAQKNVSKVHAINGKINFKSYIAGEPRSSNQSEDTKKDKIQMG